LSKTAHFLPPLSENHQLRMSASVPRVIEAPNEQATREDYLRRDAISRRARAADLLLRLSLQPFHDVRLSDLEAKFVCRACGAPADNFWFGGNARAFLVIE